MSPGPRSRLSSAAALLIAGTLATAGCAGCRRRDLPPPEGEVRVDERAGRSSVRILTDPKARIDLPEGTRLEPMQFYGSNAMPRYPPAALASQISGVEITVRALFGKDGKVGEIVQSPLAPEYTGPFAPEFRDAIEQAVRTWTFVPPELLTDGDLIGYEDDGKTEIRKIVAREYVSIRVDLAFTFEIVEGKGRVRLDRGAELPAGPP